jgi:carboxypeptidase family protein
VRGKYLAGWVFLSGAPLAGQAGMSGVVRDDSTGRPLAGVEVLLLGTRQRTLSDPAGRYVLGELPRGERVALFRLKGYLPLRLSVILVKGDTAYVDGVLVRDPVEQVETEGAKRELDYQAFEARRRLGVGTFLDSAQLHRWAGRHLVRVLSDNFDIRMITYQEPGALKTPVAIRAVTRTLYDANGQACYVRVVIDGVTIYRYASAMKPPDFSKEFTTTGSLAAIEYYRNVKDAPEEFTAGLDAGCGVLLLWTRKER